MARVPDFKRIAKEDFASENRALVDKLAFPINSFFEQVRNALNGDIDFQNLNQETITLKVRVDAGGNPATTTKFKTNIVGRSQGIQCIKAVNTTNPQVYPTTAPFISYDELSNVITIKNVTGLQQDNVYQLTLLIIGD